MSSLNPWTNLTEVPEAYSGAQSTISFSERWDQTKLDKTKETLPRPIISKMDEGIPPGEYFAPDVESETKFYEFHWAVVILSDPTSGDVIRHAPYREQFQIRPRDEVVAWGRSIEAECPWIRDFDRDFGTKSSVRDLKRLFSEISKLLENNGFEQADRILRLANPNKYNLDFATGILRATFMYRSRLPSWKTWLRKTETYLVDEGEDAEAELAGLK